MNQKEIIENIRQELENQIDKNYKKNYQKFSKEKIKTRGVRTPIVRQIAKKYFKEISTWSKNEILDICQKFSESGYNEEFIIAVQWLGEIKEDLEKKDFKKLKIFIQNIDNWAKCDDFCLRVLSHFIVKHPEFRKEIQSWTSSENRWQRRISAVSFIKGGNIWQVHPNYLKDIFKTAEALLKDKDDLVQKGYGWMLKVTAETHQKEVFNFVMKNKKEMPRTALRYAIEKMPPYLKKQAMQKNYPLRSN
jgi:3-methyladenine DNA glycosylase AlkD